MGRSRYARPIKDPCPGCAEPNKTRYRDSVCSDCKMLLAEAKTLRKDLEERAARDMAVVKVPWPYLLPYIANCKREPIQASIIDLVEAIGSRASTTHESGNRGYTYTHETTNADIPDSEPLIEGQDGGSSFPLYLIPRKAKEALEALYSGIQAATVDAFRSGHQEGRDLLMSMHSGDITLDEMERRAGIVDESKPKERKRR